MNANAKWRGQQNKFAMILGAAVGVVTTTAAGLGALRNRSRRRRAEAAQLDSEDQYRMLLDEIDDYAILMLDVNGRVVTWNAGAERIQGYEARQIIGQSFSCFFPPDYISSGRPDEILRLAAANGRHEEQSMRVRRDGSQFVASITYTALKDAAGNARGFSEITRDLSETKESGAKFRGLLEAAPDAMIVVNERGEIVLVNLQAEKQFGYHRDELLGKMVNNIVPRGFAERLVADGLRSAEDALAQQIGTGIELIGAAQGRQRVSDRDHAEPAAQHRGNLGDRGDPQHQRAQGCGGASGADGEEVPGPSGGGSGCHGRGEPGRQDRIA